MAALLFVALLAIAPSSMPLRPADANASRADCPDSRTWFAGRPPGAVARRLDQLPPGRLELTVLREVDGCPVPAVLREGIGANAVEPQPQRGPGTARPGR